MTKLLEKAIAKVQELPAEDQDTLAAALLAMAGEETTVIHLDDETRAAVREGLAQAERGEFVDDEVPVTCQRLAVTPEQIEEMDLPTRPTKTSDTRAAGFTGESVEVDAIPSPTLRAIVRAAIEQYVDHDQLAILKEAEHSERDLLRRIAGEHRNVL